METELHKGVMITPGLSEKAIEILRKNGYEVKAIDDCVDKAVKRVRELKDRGCL